jgi:hypothetical protein
VNCRRGSLNLSTPESAVILQEIISSYKHWEKDSPGGESTDYHGRVPGFFDNNSGCFQVKSEQLRCFSKNESFGERRVLK